MTVIASARSGLVTYTLPAGEYHVGDVSNDAILKDRHSDLYREMYNVPSGIISRNAKLLFVANFFPSGATWEDSPAGEVISNDGGFAIVPLDMLKPRAHPERSIIRSTDDITIAIDHHRATAVITTGDQVRTLVDDEAAILGRTRGHSLQDLATSFDRVRNRDEWRDFVDRTIPGPMTRAEIDLITHAIEFFTGSSAAVIENVDDVMFYADGFEVTFPDGTHGKGLDRVLEAVTLLN